MIDASYYRDFNQAFKHMFLVMYVQNALNLQDTIIIIINFISIVSISITVLGALQYYNV